MKKRVTPIPPIRTARILGTICGVIVCSASSTLYRYMTTRAEDGNDEAMLHALASATMVGLGYFVAVYFITALGCALYNMVAKWAGGY